MFAAVALFLLFATTQCCHYPAMFQPDDELSLLDSTIVDGFHALLFSWLDMVRRY